MSDGDPLQPGGVHAGVEVLGVAGSGAELRDAGAERRVAACRLDARRVEPLVRRDERAAILAAALAGPLQRHVDDALRALDVGHRARVVDLDERGIDDVGGDRHRLAGLDAVGAGVRLDVIGHAVDQPAHQLAPVVLVRHVLDRDVGVHLPEPRVLDGKRDRLAAPVALVGQDHLLAAPLVGAAQQRHRAGLERRAAG